MQLNNRIPSLDGFRAVSIILVLFCHSRYFEGFPYYLFDFAKQCDVGVTVFFVISGYLITSLLIKEHDSRKNIAIKSFFIRRSFRIIPVFLIYIVFIICVDHFLNLGLTKNNIIHSLTFTTNFDPAPNWYLGHLWSLAVEEQFYIFWPLLFLYFNKHMKVIVVLLIVYSSLIRILVYRYDLSLFYLLNGFFTKSDSIMIGALASLLNLKSLSIFMKKSLINYFLQLIAILLIVLFVFSSAHGKLGIIALPLGNTIISISIMYIILSYVHPKENYIYKALNSKFFTHIGILSYSIYIWQQFFIFKNVALLNKFPFNILTIYIVAYISYNFFEKPFLKIKERIIVKYKKVPLMTSSLANISIINKIE